MTKFRTKKFLDKIEDEENFPYIVRIVGIVEEEIDEKIKEDNIQG